MRKYSAFSEDQVGFGWQIFAQANNSFSILILASEDNARKTASTISVDQTEFSVSFNEYLQLMGSQNKVQEPSADALLECFEIFDTNKNGQISADMFRKIMAGKLGTETGEVEEMLSEYRDLVTSLGGTPGTRRGGEESIDYKKFVEMLQN